MKLFYILKCHILSSTYKTMSKSKYSDFDFSVITSSDTEINTSDFEAIYNERCTKKPQKKYRRTESKIFSSSGVKYSRICSYPDCDKTGYFKNNDGNGKFCKKHSTDDMINVKRKICDQCDKYAFYGLFEKKPTKCIDHKTEDMENVVSKKCEIENCYVQPVFNYPDFHGIGVRCKKHRMEGMIDVKSKMCSIDSCTKHAVTNGKCVYHFKHVNFEAQCELSSNEF